MTVPAGDTPGGLPLRLSGLRRAQRRRRAGIVAALSLLLASACVLTLTVGQTVTPLPEVLRVLSGHEVPGAGFTVGTLRLPRMIVAVLAGAAFGLGGAACQTLLRNPLASPDVIGITAGSGAAAVFAIVILNWTGTAVAILSVAGGLGTALLIHGLAWRDGVLGARLILVGIGLSAMLNSMIAYLLARAPAWSLQDALRWLTGSVNGATLDQALPVLLSLVLFGGTLLVRHGRLEAMRLGDDTAAALGVALGREKMLTVLCAVGLVAVATAVAGPVAFVAFLSGPIALRIAGAGTSPLVPAALIGAMLMLVGDFIGQHLLTSRYPVGVVTGALGAPYLVFLIVRANRTGRVT